MSLSKSAQGARVVPRIRWMGLAAVALPFLLYLVQARALSGWIVDDAGITFAYSRSLAAGHGLVAQPGAPPVEGYSNFTWLVLLTPFFSAHAFDPIWTPKVVSAVLVLVSLFLVRRILARVSPHPNLGTIFTGCLLASNTGFMVWTTSGLENPLYVLLTLALLDRMVSTDATHSADTPVMVGAGFLAAGIAMTRPDGALFFAGPLVLLAIDALRPDCPARKRTLRRIAAYVASAAIVFGGFLVFRRLYFDAWLPNTYYAKGGPTMGALAPERLLGKVDHFVGSFVPAGEMVFLLLAVLLAVAWARRTRLDRPGLPILVHALLGAAVFILLPDDWMAEFRFASVSYAPVYAFLWMAGENLLGAVRLPKPARWGLGVGAAALFVLWSVAGFATRTQAFVRQPTVPMSEITVRFAQRFDHYAGVIGATRGSVLLPDVGGTLFNGHLRVYDLGKLTDREIARTLERDQQAFYNYVFETARPTFIHTHGVWAYRARLDADPRFRRDYVVIQEEEDAWVRERFGERMLAGDYVRRDATREESLERLRQIARDSAPRERRISRRAGSRAGKA